MYATDVDGDGDTDILTARENSEALLLWENGEPGDGSTWIRHRLDVDETALAVYAVDLDGDGDTDVLDAVGNDNARWWENDGGDPTGWGSRTLPMAQAFLELRRFDAADVNGDGNTDVLAVTRFGGDGTGNVNRGSIEWWDNTAGDGTAWTQHTIEDRFVTGTQGDISAADLDRDGDVDIFAVGGRDAQMTWFENTAGDGTDWTSYSFSTNGLSGLSGSTWRISTATEISTLWLWLGCPTGWCGWRTRRSTAAPSIRRSTPLTRTSLECVRSTRQT